MATASQAAAAVMQCPLLQLVKLTIPSHLQLPFLPPLTITTPRQTLTLKPQIL